MEVKINKQWLDVVTLTKREQEACDAVRKALATGNSVAVMCIESVDTGDNRPELLTVEVS